MKFRFALPIILSVGAIPPASAEPIHVIHQQGALHGFLLIRSESGTILGHGQFTQSAVGDRVTAHSTFNFRDGSLDDEIAVFTQRNDFQFVSDHHIQRGPFFKNAIDMLVEANGNVTVKTKDKSGKEKVETSHIDLPPDLCNGIVPALLASISPNKPETTLGMVLPVGKGRLVHLIVTPDGTRSFYAVAGDRQTAHLFRIRIDLGGVAGVVAPMIGKQPSDIIVWYVEDEAPVLVREQGQLAEGTPIVSIELGGASFTRTPAAK